MCILLLHTQDTVSAFHNMTITCHARLNKHNLNRLTKPNVNYSKVNSYILRSNVCMDFVDMFLDHIDITRFTLKKQKQTKNKTKQEKQNKNTLTKVKLKPELLDQPVNKHNFDLYPPKSRSYHFY